MGRRSEAAGKGDIGHGQAGLRQQAPRLVQPEIAMIGDWCPAEMIAELTFELALRDADRQRNFGWRQGAVEALFHPFHRFDERRLRGAQTVDKIAALMFRRAARTAVHAEIAIHEATETAPREVPAFLLRSEA